MTTDPFQSDRTPTWRSTAAASGAGRPIEMGRIVGRRYRLVDVLGQGTYGRVYLARHEVLGRKFAVKVLHRSHDSGRLEIRAFLHEALVLADLDHPAIVPVFDAGWTGDGLYYIVSKYVEGGDLGQLLRQRRLCPWQAAGVIEAIAGAVDYAHGRGLVHRDIKPANILIDTGGRACLTDFGVALRDSDFGLGMRLIGTPAYMSPEQARGEGHRVDGRSDVFSLGVVLYELLTGQRPFRGRTRSALSNQILRCEPRPPCLVDEETPDDLQRVCLKALAKSADARYPSAGEMAEDLRRYLAASPVLDTTVVVAVPERPAPNPRTPASTWGHTPVWVTLTEERTESCTPNARPKGLRPFGAEDADAFPDLLPGRRDRNGMPECLSFWRSKIEGGADGSFRVGLIFGPSGVGKTSLVRAGLLPRLSGRILWVYSDGPGEATERGLLRAIRQRCPDLAASPSLSAMLTAARKGTGLPHGRKLLLVLDGFERWLSGVSGTAERSLVTALRQCDGQHVQALAIVRDDAWSAASRFMRDLGDRIIECENTSAVEPFDAGHARRVLESFGRACGALPTGPTRLTRSQGAFLDRAIAYLARGNQILPVRLSFFVEAVQRRKWVPRTVAAIEHKDVALAYLDEVLGASARQRRRPDREPAVRSILASLLPDGSAVWGSARSRHELLAASGLATRPAGFDDLMHALVEEHGIIAVVPPDESGEGDPDSSGGEPHYGLAHEALVEPLRGWLTRDTPERPPRNHHDNLANDGDRR